MVCYLTLDKNDLEITYLFYRGRKTVISFLTVFGFLRFGPGTKPFITNSRGRQVAAWYHTLPKGGIGPSQGSFENCLEVIHLLKGN